MAEKIVSPGVFTNEKDLSFLPAGIAAIGAAIVGPTKKGPAFVPTIVENFDEFIAKFGGLSEDTYVPYAVKSYLNAASTVTVVRVLQEGGYDAKAVHILASGSFGKKIVGTILPTKNTADGASTNNGFSASVFTPVSATASNGFELLGAKDHADALLMVESGMAHAFGMDDILLYGLKASSKESAKLAVVGESIQVEPYAIMFRKDDPKFQALVNKVITNSMKSGAFEKAYKKWFQTNIPPKNVNLNAPMSKELKDNLKALSDKPAL